MGMKEGEKNQADRQGDKGRVKGNIEETKFKILRLTSTVKMDTYQNSTM
jgi:hypothetical protein